MRHREGIRNPLVLGTLLFGTLCGATLMGCEEANHDLADPPNPVVAQPATDDPVTADGTTGDRVRVEGTDERMDVNIDIDRESGAAIREERRGERRERIRDALDDVNVDVDGERTDVQIGDGKIDVDAQ